jgi:hypothetical protein
MPAQVIVVPASAEQAIADAVREVSRALDPGDLVLVASNLSAYDLELARSHDVRGASGLAPADLLGSGCSTVFGARTPRTGTGIRGRVEWWGTHPDRGDFVVELAWRMIPPDDVHATVRHFHEIPIVGARRAMRVETKFLRTSAAAVRGSIVYEIRPRPEEVAR